MASVIPGGQAPGGSGSARATSGVPAAVDADTWPVTYDASSVTRKAVAAAMSSGRPMRRTGFAVRAPRPVPPSVPFSSLARSIGVSMNRAGWC